MNIKHIPKNKSGVYKILNSVNGKIYIGSSKNLYERAYDHIRLLKLKKHQNRYLQRAYDKYGDVFIFSVVELIGLEKMIECEQFHITKYESSKPEIGYNLSSTAFPVTHSDETKKLISKAGIGRKHTEEAKRKIIAALIGRPASQKSIDSAKLMGKSNIGRKHSEEEKLKISIASKGKKWTIEQRENLSKLLKGKKKSDAHRKSLSKANIGKKQPKEQIEKTRIRMMGNRYAEANTNNQNAKGHIHTEEWKVANSKRLKERWAKKTPEEKILQAEKQRQTCLNKKLNQML